MRKKKYSPSETEINDVLVYQERQLSRIHFPDTKKADQCISDSLKLLQDLGREVDLSNISHKSSVAEKRILHVPSWEQLRDTAVDEVGSGHAISELFTEEELIENRQVIQRLNKEFSSIHKMDKIDISIAVAGGLLGALVDILLVGIPEKTHEGIKAGPLSNYVRDYFDKRYPEEEMQRLANSKVSKVPYDAQDNRNTTVHVEGLSAYYHRLLQFGHDPFLGFIIGVADILNGTMTTVDKKGKIVCQVMENYADRKESNVFAAICKQITHLKSDITTSMGLPAPLMELFNLFQFGSIGEENLTIAEIVQGMYYEGYDFIHFCSMSIPAMITEVVIRLGYAFKRLKEGKSVKESIPFSTNREKYPKLATMLFVGQSAAVAINAGKVAFTKNPMAINYSQWLLFAKNAYSQLEWVVVKKPALRDKYVMGKINEELEAVLNEIDDSFMKFSSEYMVVMD